MRRCLHSLLVALLVCSLALDAARACGRLQEWASCPPAAGGAFVIVEADDWDCTCRCAVEPACGEVECCWAGGTIVAPAAGDSSRPPVGDCCAPAWDAPAVVVATAIEPVDAPATASVLASEPSPTRAALPAAEPVPAPPALEPVAESPPSVPVEEPVMEPAAAAPPIPEAAPHRPAPRNVFEKADEAADGSDADAPVPAVEPAADPEPETDPARAPRAAREPLRRWVDDTGAYAVVGRLIDVRGDRVEILRADGRSVTVPRARLSGFDRGYVAAATARIARSRQPGPRSTATVGR